MTEAIDRRVALVTGAAQGIGLGIAEALAESGCRVVLADVNEGAVKVSADLLAKRGHTTIGLPLDVSRSPDWERAMVST